MKREAPKLNNYLKLQKVFVATVVVKNHKFFLSKGHEENLLLKVQSVHTDIDQL